MLLEPHSQPTPLLQPHIPCACSCSCPVRSATRVRRIRLLQIAAASNSRTLPLSRLSRSHKPSPPSSSLDRTQNSTAELPLSFVFFDRTHSSPKKRATPSSLLPSSSIARKQGSRLLLLRSHAFDSKHEPTLSFPSADSRRKAGRSALCSFPFGSTLFTRAAIASFVVSFNNSKPSPLLLPGWPQTAPQTAHKRLPPLSLYSTQQRGRNSHPSRLCSALICCEPPPFCSIKHCSTEMRVN